MNNVQLSEMSKKNLTVKKHRGQYQVIVHNDNHNTFDHVSNCLIEICGQNYYQAVQCALIIHNSQRCSVYTDSYDDCADVAKELRANGLKTSLEKC